MKGLDTIRPLPYTALDPALPRRGARRRVSAYREGTMWKRDEMTRSESPPARINPGTPNPPAPTPAASVARTAAAVPTGHNNADIGKSVVIKGDLSGNEDLRVEGRIEGKIQLREHELTIGSNGRIKATIAAKVATIKGHVVGNITASERISIQQGAQVEGDISAPAVTIAEGARFKGRIDMDRPVTPERTVAATPPSKVERPTETDRPAGADRPAKASAVRAPAAAPRTAS